MILNIYMTTLCLCDLYNRFIQQVASVYALTWEDRELPTDIERTNVTHGTDRDQNFVNEVCIISSCSEAGQGAAEPS